ncbi:MAG: membrane protein insertion efficiency factor YidD [Candidatus Parcubacteria bacterium]|nr:membrane protein insertion efficiency factor YidD [Candidatus Parcubacteria bacterium]
MTRILLKIIKFYQRTSSPDHGIVFAGNNMRCRFYPSCSQYTYEAIERYGASRGLLKGLVRVLKCNPLSKGGYNPVVSEQFAACSKPQL